jgi:hypothetical protein
MSRVSIFRKFAPLILAAVVAFAHSAPSARADDADASRAFLTQYCQTCHSGDKPKGDFRISDLKFDFADAAGRGRWAKVAELLESGTMPPDGKPQPAAGEVDKLLDWIGRETARGESAQAAAAGTVAKGRVVLRRLNRSEYVNTVRDLLGVEIELKDLLPADTVAGGFDNGAESLHISSYHLDAYLAAAERVLDAAIASGPQPPKVSRRISIKDERTVKPTGSVYRHLDDGVAIFASWVSANIQVTLWQFRTHEPGKYRFKITGYGYQTEKRVAFHVMSGPLNAAAQQDLVGYYDVPAKTPTTIEFVRTMDRDQTLRIIADNLGAIPPDVQKVGAENYKGPGLVIQSVDVEGPLYDAWPPAGHTRLLGALEQKPIPDSQRRGRREVVSADPSADAKKILADFARRAFRRPVTEADIRPFLARVETKLQAGDSFEQALRVGLRGVLVSPHFLFLREKPGTLDDYALATRLSYFLWSSMPDDALFALAERGELRKPEILRGQVERMLADPKAAAFTENFAGQWLGLRAIDDTMPDRMLYPEFDDVLKTSMLKEVTLFFDEVLKNDLSLTNFIDSDFTMLNGRLAEHYGIPGFEGLEFRKAELPTDSRRGGVLTMGAVLKVTANGTTTSPILRGAWVLDRILGTPPPKPSVDVEAVEPDIRGATTIRQQLEKHRSRTECAGCHARIDPPGFALENFDVIGGWRDRYRSIGSGDPVVVNGRKRRYLAGPKVDAADVLADGRKFQDIDEFKQLLLADKPQLARSLTEKLLTYATGAAPTTADRADIEAIVERVGAKNYGFRALVHEITQSETFQSK